jgi:hypothetical protein
MPRNRAEELTEGKAVYVLERLLADRRVTQTQISRYLAELPRTIRDLEARIRQLRGDDGAAEPRNVDNARKVRRPRAGRSGRSAKRNGKALGGMYGGLIRRVPPAEQAQFEAIKSRDGIAAAIAALRARKR